MQHLQKLYDEITPKFNNLVSKRDEVNLRIIELEKALQEAEENYDIDKIGKLTNQLTSTKRVSERIIKDLEEFRQGINDNDLFRAVTSAAEKDFQAVNKSEEVQDRLKKIDELVQQTEAIQKELQEEAYTIYSELRKETDKFRPILPSRRGELVLVRLKNFHLVEDDKE